MHSDPDGRADDLWLVDAGGGMRTRFTFDPAVDFFPVWSGDGSMIAFSSMRGGHPGDLYAAEVANPSNVQLLMSSAKSGVRNLHPVSWSRKGDLIVLNTFNGADADIWLYSLKAHRGQPYIATRFNEHDSSLSHDDASMAYVSDESGHDEIYVEQFPTHAGRRQVSTGGGALPRWRAGGRELFYIGAGGKLMSVDMTKPASAPQPLFEIPGACFDVTADGQRFVVDRPVDDPFRLPLTFVSNWTGQRNDSRP